MLLLPSLPGGFGRPSGQVPNHPLVGEEFPVATAKDPNNECPTPKERVKTLQLKSREKWPRGPYGGERWGWGGQRKLQKNF